MADDKKKRNHSKSLLFLLYIAHLLPLACKSEEILEYIFRKIVLRAGKIHQIFMQIFL